MSGFKTPTLVLVATQTLIPIYSEQ